MLVRIKVCPKSQQSKYISVNKASISIWDIFVKPLEAGFHRLNVAMEIAHMTFLYFKLDIRPQAAVTGPPLRYFDSHILRIETDLMTRKGNSIVIIQKTKRRTRMDKCREVGKDDVYMVRRIDQATEKTKIICSVGVDNTVRINFQNRKLPVIFLPYDQGRISRIPVRQYSSIISAEQTLHLQGIRFLPNRCVNTKPTDQGRRISGSLARIILFTTT